jgi:hypothetical protein
LADCPLLQVIDPFPSAVSYRADQPWRWNFIWHFVSFFSAPSLVVRPQASIRANRKAGTERRYILLGNMSFTSDWCPSALYRADALMHFFNIIEISTKPKTWRRQIYASFRFFIPAKNCLSRGQPPKCIPKRQRLLPFMPWLVVYLLYSVLCPLLQEVKNHRTCYLRVERCIRRLFSGRARPRKSDRTHNKSSYRKEKWLRSDCLMNLMSFIGEKDYRLTGGSIRSAPCEFYRSDKCVSAEKNAAIFMVRMKRSVYRYTVQNIPLSISSS